MNDSWTIYTDGGSRGNPGPAAYAYVIKRPGAADIEEKGYLGQTTNNIAEYTGLVKALEHARELGGRKLIVNSDSELMVKQMNGLYKVKNEGLRPFYLQATALRKHFDSVTIKHIYREQNSQADALCNEAMDSPHDAKPRVLVGQDSSTVIVAKETASQARPHCADRTPLMQALEIMRESAELWARGDSRDPLPGDVLNQIVEILRPQDAD